MMPFWPMKRENAGMGVGFRQRFPTFRKGCSFFLLHGPWSLGPGCDAWSCCSSVACECACQRADFHERIAGSSAEKNLGLNVPELLNQSNWEAPSSRLLAL